MVASERPSGPGLAPAAAPDHLDVLIVGGGPVGAALALGLRDSGLRWQLLETRPWREQQDPRALALSEGSRQLLAGLGAWPGDVAQPIEIIHVSQRGYFGRARLSGRELGVPALGHVLPYGALHQSLFARLEATAPQGLCLGARVTGVQPLQRYVAVRSEHQGQPRLLTARLVVLADGGRGVTVVDEAPPSEQPYAQEALVAEVACSQFQATSAFERFTRDGPLALLPLRGRYSLVWTVRRGQGAGLMALAEADFLDALQAAFGDRVGRFTEVSGRALFPLTLRVAAPYADRRVVRLGNAAQTLHPVAGQGFNLGLRDAWVLADVLRTGRPEQVGEAAQLAAYRERRHRDKWLTLSLTHWLAEEFTRPLVWRAHLRGAALFALDHAGPFKRLLAEQMMFGVRS